MNRHLWGSLADGNATEPADASLCHSWVRLGEHPIYGQPAQGWVLFALSKRLTMPNHSYIKGSTLRTICIHASIAQDEFLKAYEET
jgi:hypothetical protein